jgi:hypothetical protein
MRHRFALNYSTLATTPTKRYDAFLEARSVYDLRSTIAHGGHLDSEVTIGRKKIKLGRASDRARAMLRGVIKRFLPDGPKPGFIANQYWERAYFGLTTTDGPG